MLGASSGSLLAWGGFLFGVCVLLALDLGVFHRKAHRVSLREAAIWSVAWVLLSLVFNAYVFWAYGSTKGYQFLNAYIIEKALSVDNIFVFIVLFRYMKVPVAYLHRVLYAGILGAIILRGVFIVAGLGIVNAFRWTLYFFGAFLLYTGVRLLFIDDDDDPMDKDNWVKRQAERFLPVTDEFSGPRFFVRRGGKTFATTLFVTLLMIETADVVFALDSIPAIFGITTDPFIVFTSNICAIMGLRAMFFLLENVLDRLRFLNAGLGLVLSFIGAKMILERGLGPLLEPVHIDPRISLSVVGTLLIGSVVASLLFPAKSEASADADDDATDEDEANEADAGEADGAARQNAVSSPENLREGDDGAGEHAATLPEFPAQAKTGAIPEAASKSPGE